jgi:predicted nuclease with TOPRIM domain
MANTAEQLNNALEDLKRQRDELKVRLHLGKAEVRDEWAKLETRLEEVKATLSKVGHEAGKTAEGVGAAMRLALDEIKKGYERLKAAL